MCVSSVKGETGQAPLPGSTPAESTPGEGAQTLLCALGNTHTQIIL
jgi:hypothetical protein